ncbi:MAG: FAD:protein FMN transferase [Faecousia sp.]
MKRFFTIYLTAALLTAFLLTGCTTSAPQEGEFFAMDTLMSVKLWGGEAATSDVSAEVNRLEALLSATRETSVLSQLNAAGSAELSGDTASLLAQALALSERTGGTFDPTVYPLVKAWGFPSKEYRVPNRTELDTLLACIGTEHVHFDGATVTMDAGTRLDLGGIAKGYAAQCCAELLKGKGVEAAILSLGGNVQTVGSKPDGSAWVVGIADPSDPSQAIAVLTFEGPMALVTSGAYQRYFEENGVIYHHILDPQTGLPAGSGLLSVTVLAEDGTLADGLSTALFVMGLEEGTRFWRESNDFEAVFLTTEGKLLATEGAAVYLSGCEYSVIER